MLTRFMNDDNGATAIEYGLLAALIAVAIIVAITAVGNSLSGTFSAVSTELNGATASGS